MPKSLVPYNEDYVLIHKRSLFVNQFTMSLMAQFLADKLKMPEGNHEQILNSFAQIAIAEAGKLSNEKISEVVLDSIIAGEKADCTQVIKTSF
ncbi:hypothetical protein [Trichormus variabilis]|uniref:Uncharacterized protein n=1 Tax=Trichormus variabilis SAG 1403-4b TaxID=447716 RepID=A0A433UIQ6_ANAVA|nr:hypothetical protein [Trichormus variabilis]MBD2628830.1 hypothetical protein [Trichormus variabilis FACHB-164]RUS93763.1 hypothetical protein DSM107003_42640 [Trichormus variabilis SAG 1403-4b]